MQYLLDTNTCIDVMKHQGNVVERMSRVSPDDCAVSVITSFELFTGVAKCAAPAKEQAKVELLLNTLVELPINRTAALRAAQIRAQLESQGEMIGPYDILLAAQSLSAELVLVTSNTGEFQRVAGLSVENWRVAAR